MYVSEDLVNSAIVILFLCLGLAQTSFATSPDESNCLKNDVKACLRSSLRIHGHQSEKFIHKAVEIGKKTKDRKDIRSGLIAESAIMGTDPKLISSLDTFCKLDKIPEACFIASAKEKAGRVEKKEAKIFRESIISASCENGNGFGCWLMAMLNFDQDLKGSTIKLLTRACELKDYESCITIGDDYSARENYLEAEKIYAIPCKAKYSNACEKIAYIYRKQNNNEKSEKFLNEQCDLGVGSSCGYLASLMAEKKNLPEVERLYRKGCNNEHESSCIDLATQVEVPKKQYGDAKVLLNAACNNENDEACFQLGWINNDLIFDQDAALKAWKKACDHHQGKSCFRMAVIFKKGQTPTKKKLIEKLDFAKKYLMEECDGGDNDSCKILSQFPALYAKIQ